MVKTGDHGDNNGCTLTRFDPNVAKQAYDSSQTRAQEGIVNKETRRPKSGERTKDNPVSLFAKLQEIEPAFGLNPENRFEKEIAEGESAVPALLAHLKSGDADVRLEAAEALGNLGDFRAVEPLRELLQDPDGEVRTACAVSLFRIGDEHLFPEVVKALRHEDPRVVIGAAVVLGRLGDRRVVPNLVEAFKTENMEMGAAVAWALGQCGDPACLPWLITALEQGFATANVCEALGRIGDPKAVPALLKALSFTSDDTRAYAARAIGMIQVSNQAPAMGHLARAAQLSTEKSVSMLRRLLKDRSRKVRLCAAIALYEFGEKAGGRAVAQEFAD
jgi:HEAT repeat protein